MKKWYFPIVIWGIVEMAGCTWLAPDYQRPAMDMPSTWGNSSQAPATTSLQHWWRIYRDPVLDRLVQEAMANNGDLARIAARMQQAKAQYDFAFSNRFPLVAGSGLTSRSHLDINESDLLSGSPGSFSFLGAMLSYEVDVWGKLASAAEAEKTAFWAAAYNRDAVHLSIVSGVVQLYFTLRALDADIAITRDTIRSREEAYQIIDVQYQHEAVNGLVLRQSEAELEGTRAQLPKLLVRKEQAESAMAVLLGRSPREILAGQIPRGTEIQSLPVPPVVPADLPSALLVRRPDIAAAEQALISSNFVIGTAKALYFPSISLSSLLGVSHIDIQNIYNGTASTWYLGASLVGPIVDFGRTQSGVELAEAKNKELLAAYKNSIRTAFKEVRDALSVQQHAEREEQAQAREEKAVAEALRLAKLRYSSGYSSYIEVLDAERSLYAAQLALITAKLNRLNGSVALYKALGGGWEHPQ